MLVTEIKRIGYFDSVTVDGYMLPFYDDNGIEINYEQSIIEAIDSGKAFNQGIARLRINIAGNSFNNEKAEDNKRMQKHREKDLGLRRVAVGNMDRYYIAYVDIYILKSDNLLPKLLEKKGKRFEDISKVSKNNYEMDILTAATEIQNRIQRETKERTECNVAILDKIYVNEHFRRCKISTWIHNNFADLIKTTSTIDIVASLLVAGDFANESKSKFMMDRDEYRKMLISHYKNVGYKTLKDEIMYKRFIPKKGLFSL